jgi:hypothetical protein
MREGRRAQEECEDEPGDALHAHLLPELLFAAHMAPGGGPGAGWTSRLDVEGVLDELEHKARARAHARRALAGVCALPRRRGGGCWASWAQGACSRRCTRVRLPIASPRVY